MALAINGRMKAVAKIVVRTCERVIDIGDAVAMDIVADPFAISAKICGILSPQPTLNRHIEDDQLCADVMHLGDEPVQLGDLLLQCYQIRTIELARQTLQFKGMVRIRAPMRMPAQCSRTSSR